MGTNHHVLIDPNIRFWAKVDKSGECWNWTGYVMPTGYGQFGVSKRDIVLAHRFAYTVTVGDIPEGLVLDHICHNRKCVRPDHLRLATRKQNNENQLGAHRDSKSGIRGVSWSKSLGKWRAQVGHNGKFVHLGYFDSIEDADVAARAKRNELFTHNDSDRRTA